MNTSYDIVIAGGGMVGISLALSLHHHCRGQLKVAVVESFPLPPVGAAPEYRPSFDARSTALSYGSAEIYRQLGVWSTLSQYACDIRRIHVSDRGHFGSAEMTAASQGWPALGHVVENAWLGSVLLDRLRRDSNVEMIAPAAVSEVEICDGAAVVTVADKATDESRTVEAKLLVVADGADSGLRQKLGIHGLKDDYHQVAYIANIATERPHEGCAFERFTADGPLAMLPLLPDQQQRSRSALVWTFPADEAAAVADWSDESFLENLQARFGYRLGRLVEVGQRASYPLRLVRAEEQIRRRVVVMGNAAHSLHPVAGQGFNLALRDADCLAELLAGAQTRGQDIGELTVLQSYLQRQGRDQWLTTAFSDRVTRLFSNRQPLLSVARNLGLLGLDMAPPLKSHFVAQAAGMAAAGGSAPGGAPPGRSPRAE